MLGAVVAHVSNRAENIRDVTWVRELSVETHGFTMFAG
jgi:hypothetical protein